MDDDVLTAIDRCVDRALAGGPCLSDLINEMLLGRPIHRDDPPWTAAQRAVWSAAVDRWLARRQRRGRRKLQHTRVATLHPPTVAEAHLALEIFRVGGPWWQVPHMTWPLLGAALQLGGRATEYHLAAQGWVFAGKGVSRVIQCAPCRACSTPHPAEALQEGGICATCRHP
jgi:hypothetical protein